MEPSRQTKIISAKALKAADFTYPEIAEILEISEKSVYNYVRKITDEEWESTYQIITRLLSLKEDTLGIKTLNLIEGKMGQAELSELISLYRVVKREKEAQHTSGINIVGGGEMKLEFICEDS